MNTRKSHNLLCIVFLLLMVSAKVRAQDLWNYNHYFAVPHLYNPSYFGRAEYIEIDLLHRQQWAGIDGAPTFSNVVVQFPNSQKIASGLIASNFERGLLNTLSIQGATSYSVNITPNGLLSFGLSGGVGRTAIDLTEISDLTDPALAGALDRSFFLEGQAGISFKYKNLDVAFALPTLFEESLFSDSDFQEVGLDALNHTISSVSYNIELSPFFAFQPMLLYRTTDGLDPQIQGFATVYYRDVFWIGSLYGQDFGFSAYGGININAMLSFGYSYDFATEQVSGFTDSSHEFFLSLRLGNKRVDRSPRPNPVFTEATTPIPEEEETAPLETSMDEDLPVEEEEAFDNDTAQKEDIEPTTSQNEVADPVPQQEKEIIEDIVEEQNETPETREEPPAPLSIDQFEGVDHEIEEGYFIVVGAFREQSNAENYSNEINQSEYDSKVIFSSAKQLYYVYLSHSENYEELVDERRRIRNIDKFEFQNAWIFHFR